MKLTAIALALGALFGASGAWYIQDLRWTRTEALYKTAAASALEQATTTALAETNAAQARAEASSRLYDKLKEKLSAENALLLDRVRSGGVRLTAPGSTCAPTPTSPAPGADAPGACELHARTSADLTALAGRADAVALKLNALQDHVRGLSCGGPDGIVLE